MKVGLGLTVFAAAFALTACGSSGPKLQNKEQAAQAVFGAGNMGEDGGQATLLQLAQSAATDISIGHDCPKGGTVSAHVSGDVTDTTGSFALTIEFDGCVTGSYTDPKTQTTTDVAVSGSLDYAFDVSGDGTGTGSVLFTINGSLDFSGGIDDSVDVNNVTFSLVSTDSTLKLSLSGEIKTSTQTFTYSADEAFSYSETGEITASAAEP